MKSEELGTQAAISTTPQDTGTTPKDKTMNTTMNPTNEAPTKAKARGNGGKARDAVLEPNQGRVTGTKEWADSNVNIQNGCEHNCRYCYAKQIALRFHRTTPNGWRKPVLHMRKVEQNRGKRRGRIMFPSTHDITLLNIGPCIVVLTKLLAAGNQVLVVTKPRLKCVERLCRELAPYQDQILFRFTIGSANDAVLKFWEPGAPTFAERLACLRYAYDQGFKTSVSCEPMLDSKIDDVIDAVRPYVTDAVWLGRVNRLKTIVKANCPGDDETAAAARKLNETWNDAAVRALYERLKDDPKIRYKDSIKKVVGLPLAKEKGRDA